VSSTLCGLGFRPRQGSHAISRWLSAAPPPEARNDLTQFPNYQKRLLPSRSKYNMTPSSVPLIELLGNKPGKGKPSEGE